MKNTTFIRYLAIVPLFVMGWATAIQAQELKKASYYLNVNAGGGGQIHDISDEKLSIQYNDAYGRWKEIPLKVYDWKRNLVTTLNLDKAYGLNSYVFNLKAVYGAWEMDEVYTCELKDESGRKYELRIRLVPPPEELGPQVSILVDPEHPGCEDALSFNLVKFYGDVKGGKAPYTVNWFVVNDSRTDFLYQPREELIASPGKTSVIAVDKNPAYYVMLQVKDACGNVKEGIVYLTCEENRKKINTIFVEELKSPLPNSPAGN